MAKQKAQHTLHVVQHGGYARLEDGMLTKYTPGKPGMTMEEMKQSEADALMAARKEEYGEAWLTTGRITRMLTELELLKRISSSAYFYNWMIILNKLIRLLQTPTKIDSWRDIEVYARLVADRLSNEPSEGPRLP